MKKAVIITGGAKRVGAAIAVYFARQGYDIALHYNHSKAEAEAVKKEVEAAGTACQLFACDLADSKALPKLMSDMKAAMPHCVALINNASAFERAPLMETDEALFDRQMDINFKAPFFLTQAFAKNFGAGCVVNIVDTDISKIQCSHFAYLLSKKALADFTLMAARELGPKIRVNGVCPGIMLPSGEWDETYIAQQAQLMPLRATATVEQTVAATRMLIENTALTGQLLYVDGGKHVL